MLKKKLRVLRIRRENRRIKTYRNGDYLPAWKFFKILETNDYRYLLDCEKPPKYYNSDSLIPIYDKITSKIDEITGKGEHEEARKKLCKNIKELNTLTAVESAFCLLKYQKQESIEALKYFGVSIPDFSIKSMQRVKSAIRRMKTKMDMDRISRQNIIDASSSGKIPFNRAVIQASNILKREIDGKKISVNDWYYLQLELDNLAAEIKKAKKSGQTH